MKTKFVLLFLLSFLLLGSLKAVTPPSGIVAYVPVTIQNSQTTATPNPFQQMIQVNTSKYSTYIKYNSSFANFEFFYANGTIIPAWIESYSAPILTIWAKLKSIPASSSLTIYLGFASKSTNLLSSSGTSGIGEAPQLSPTYGQYDDGASVFNFYDNFAGTTLSSKWINNGMSVTVNNGVTLTPSGSAGTWSRNSITYNTNVYNTNYIAESYTKVTTLGNADINPIMILNSNSATAYSGSYDFVDDGIDLTGTTPSYNHDTQTSSGSDTRTPISMPSGYSYSAFNIYQIYVNGASVGVAVDYSNIINTQTNYNPSTQYLGIGSWICSSAPTTFTQWFRTRAYPPNGVMPSVSFGSVQIVNPTISISPSPPYTYPNPTITITATGNSGDSLVLYFQKTQVATGTTSITYTINRILAAGTYNATAVDLTTSGRTELDFNVNQAWIKITITNSTNSIYTSNYANTFTATYTTTNVALAIQQKLQFNLYVQSSLINSTNTANSLKTTINSIGTWTIQASVVGNQNFSSNTTTITYFIHVPVWFLNLTSSGNQITSDIFLVSNTGITTYLPFQIKANQTASGVTYDLWLYKGGSWNLNLTNVANFTYTYFQSAILNPTGGTYSQDVIFTQNTVLQSTLKANNIYINPGVTVTTNGYPIVAAGTFKNLGTVTGGNNPNAPGGAPPSSCSGSGGAGVSIPNSYAGSGGGGASQTGPGGAGGSTLAPGGAAGSGAGSTPTAPTMSETLVDLFFTNTTKYLASASGGAGGYYSGVNCYTGGWGGQGVYGVMIIANNLIAGTIITKGNNGGNGGPGGGGSGGGAITLIYKTSYTAGSYIYSGGSRGCDGNGANCGGNGGNSQVIVYQTTNSSWFSLGGVNGFAVVEKTTQNNVKVNKTITVTPTNINIANLTQKIQYYLTVFQIGLSPQPKQVGLWSYYNGKPSKLILSSIGSNQTTFSTDTLTPNGIATLVYPFTSFNVSVSLGSFSPFDVKANSTTPNSYIRRPIVNITIFNQKSQNLKTITSTASIYLYLYFNGYTFTKSLSVTNYATFYLYVPLSNGGSTTNPTINILNNSVNIPSEPGFYPSYNMFMPVGVNYGQWVTWRVGLVDGNGSLYTFQVYSSTGYATNDYIVVQEGSGSGTIQAQSYFITQVPFSLPLENGQAYKFVIYNNGGTLLYQTALTTWPSFITINIPSGGTIYQYQTAKPNVNCSSGIKGNQTWIYCIGFDPTNFVSKWVINFYNTTSILNTQSLVKSTRYLGNSFSINTTFSSNDQISIEVIALVGRTLDPSITAYTGVFGNVKAIGPWLHNPFVGVIALALVLTLTFGALATGMMDLAIFFAVVAVWVLAIFGMIVISPIVLGTITFFGAITIFISKEKQSKGA